MKKLSLFWQLLKLNIKRNLVYRVNFLITIWAMILWIGLYVVFFEVLFTHVDSIAGWGRGEMLLFLAFFYFVNAIGNIFFKDGFEQFSERVRRGQLDYVLTKPSSTQVLVFFDTIRLDHFIDIAITLLLGFYVHFQTNLDLSLLHIMVGLALALVANVLFYSFMLLFACLILLVDRFEAAGSFMWAMSQISRYPRQIYTGAAKLALQFILPLALVASIPAEFALNTLDGKMLGYFVGISIVFFLIGNGCFTLALRRYSSAN